MKITKAIAKNLSKRAKSLPEMLEPPKIFTRVRVLGATLIASGTKKVENEDIDPKKFYLAEPKNVKVNHLKNLKTIFEKAPTEEIGYKQCDEYMVEVLKKDQD